MTESTLDIPALLEAYKTIPNATLLAIQFKVNRRTVDRALRNTGIVTKSRGRPTLVSILTPDQLQAHRDAQKLQRRVRWARKDLWKKYRLRPEQVLAMYQTQEGKCALCTRPFPRLFVDHDHETGKVRALLCSNCNTGLGLFQEKIETLQSAIQYLTDHAS